MKAAIFSVLCALAVALAIPLSAAELKVGDPAPDFSLAASDGKTYKLSDFKGKQAVVIAWFPRAFTQGCTIECKSLAENGEKIRKFDVAYFMASVD
jgi:peroxiredoxin Q/BCP